MTMKILDNIDLNSNQILNTKLQQLASDITASGNEGIVFYNTVGHVAKISNGTAIDTITNILENVTASGALHAGAITAKAIALTVDAASGSVPGTMSAADFTKLGAATAANTASTLVLRDGSNNFSAGTITAALTGTASNASQLNSQSAAFYLARANHTGTQLAATISDFDTQVNTHTINQLTAPTADFSMNTHKITALVDPTGAQDAATKNYVDSVVQGLDIHPSARLASAGSNVSVTYTATGGTSARGQITAAPNSLDGVSLAANNRILLKDQTTGAQNGIYVVSTLGTGANGVWDRAGDFDQDVEVTAGAFVFIEEGTVNADTGWVLTTNNPITIGGASGTTLAFAQFSSSATVTASNGILKTGNNLTAVPDTTSVNANSLSVSSTGITIATTYIGQASITTLGTVTTGVWSGTAVAVAKGGTGGTSQATAKTGLGFTSLFTSLLAGSSTSYVIAHGMGSANCVAQVIEVSSGQIVFPDIVLDATNVTITFAVAPSSNAYRVNVVG